MDPDRSPLLVEIVDALDDQGVAQDAYQLHDYVDPDALSQLVDSVEEPFSVSFTVKGVQVTVTEDGVTAEQLG